ncbi:hypothetical protein KIPB_007922 [Kipferlia bialata]|uniref:G protein-coupled receptor GPR1/2/3 C-terminal domain-containing protein n=1 Tax=Kipferlia bialata TaxID=797122 RepID=A0A9K3GJG7_9EUKA|nr:hypothetical protein KIPB_007922 [Kipferlia bialata]|eukprot:g7922.t1
MMGFADFFSSIGYLYTLVGTLDNPWLCQVQALQMQYFEPVAILGSVAMSFHIWRTFILNPNQSKKYDDSVWGTSLFMWGIPVLTAAYPWYYDGPLLQVVNKLKLYILAFIFSWFFPGVNRLIQTYHHSSFSVPWLNYAMAFGSPLMGFMDAVVYGMSTGAWQMWQTCGNPRQRGRRGGVDSFV